MFAGAGQPAGSVANDERGTITDEVKRPERGTNPWSENPGHGSAMKRARKVRGGANRRERAKRCGRNVGGPGMPVGEWTPRADVVKRDETPRKAPAAATRAGRPTRDGTLETNGAHERMNPSDARSAGAVRGGRPPRSVGNDEASVGSDQPDGSGTTRATRL